MRNENLEQRIRQWKKQKEETTDFKRFQDLTLILDLGGEGKTCLSLKPV